MEESDTDDAVADAIQAKVGRGITLTYAEKRLGAAGEAVKAQLLNIRDLERLERMVRRAVTATAWEEILETP
jgi:hypothetical protein